MEDQDQGERQQRPFPTRPDSRAYHSPTDEEHKQGDPSRRQSSPRPSHRGSQGQRVTLSHDGDDSRRSRHDDEPRYDRIFKSFKIEPFTGRVAPNAFDAGAAAWFEGFKLQLRTEELIHNVYLTEPGKNALRMRNLSGDARDWYIANQEELLQLGLETLGLRLKREFGSRLSTLQVCRLVASERKRPAESYRKFSVAYAQWQLRLHETSRKPGRLTTLL
ncbi:hypothetical protein GN958_ATG07486 [Phytophthora infestans]|uniref:Retrotransposon gag domain-containing protein n=1 Tax=Phytophthora infestans TaxID=4787 RepID=A0A8S9URB3_PHYIN|nr:hypothetical protein GN958_ATG07486 [Phytophthora infestans]